LETREEALWNAQLRAAALFEAIVERGLIRAGITESELNKEINVLARTDFGVLAPRPSPTMRALMGQATPTCINHSLGGGSGENPITLGQMRSGGASISTDDSTARTGKRSDASQVERQHRPDCQHGQGRL
jgi:hypothetical protein